MEIKLPLWSHQADVATLASQKPLLLLAGCGTGKTLAALAAARDAGARRVLILTVRAACQNVWQAEFETNTDLASDDYLILDNSAGTIKKRVELLMRTRHQQHLIVVTNYEAAMRMGLENYWWDMVIADESHRLKSHNSALSIGLGHELRSVPLKLAMTGTAWDDRPTDVFGQERFLYPGKKGPSYLTSKNFGSWTAFFDRYVNYITRDNIPLVQSYKNLDELAATINDHFLFIDRDKVLDLPPVQHIKRYVTLAPEHMEAYDEFEKEMFYAFEDGEVVADNQLVLELRLQQMAGGYYPPMDGDGTLVPVPNGMAKQDALAGLVEEIGNEPMIIFCRFSEDIRLIRLMLSAMDITHAELSGRVNELQRWQRGAAQVLIAQIQAGGVGLNLTRAAVVIMYSTGNSATDYTQALYRVDRPGQTRKVTIYHLLAGGTVDVEIQKRLSSKKQDSSSLLKAMDTSLDVVPLGYPRRRTLGRVIRNG